MAVEKKEVGNKEAGNKEAGNKALDQLRKERNQELVRKMRAGESLSNFDSQSSWFPERPKIEKNLEAIQKLYGKTTESKLEGCEKSSPNLLPDLKSALVVPLARGKKKIPADKQKR